MRLGVVMDPIERIKPWKDTTLSFMLGAQARGWSIDYIEPGWLFAENGRARSQARRVRVFDDRQHWFEFEEARVIDLTELDIILQRQDPPVTLDYHYITALLELAERGGTLVANKPAALRASNEKLLAQRYPDLCPPTLITRSIDQLQAFLTEQDSIVVKPLDAMGGSSVFRVDRGDMNAQVIFESMTRMGSELTMAQRFLPAVRVGDRRILLINGEPIDHALLRTPPADSFRANLAVGGQGTVVPLRARDREIAARVGPELARAGLWFVGLDVIGDSLTEINVTSPTCAREIEAACDYDITGQTLDFLAERHGQLATRTP